MKQIRIIVYSLFALFFLIIAQSCKEDSTPTAPDLNADEVGLINDTNGLVSWGIRFSSTSGKVSEGDTGKLPYSDEGYWVSLLGNWETQIIDCPAGRSILVEGTVDSWTLSIR